MLNIWKALSVTVQPFISSKTLIKFSSHSLTSLDTFYSPESINRLDKNTYGQSIFMSITINNLRTNYYLLLMG